MQTENRGKENKWTQSIAVGSKTFIEKMKEALGFRAKGRKIICTDDTFELREVLTPYGKDRGRSPSKSYKKVRRRGDRPITQPKSLSGRL
jgi:hypothetical protein